MRGVVPVIDGLAEMDHSEQHENKNREDEGELGKCLSALVADE